MFLPFLLQKNIQLLERSMSRRLSFALSFFHRFWVDVLRIFDPIYPKDGGLRQSYKHKVFLWLSSCLQVDEKPIQKNLALKKLAKSFEGSTSVRIRIMR